MWVGGEGYGCTHTYVCVRMHMHTHVCAQASMHKGDTYIFNIRLYSFIHTCIQTYAVPTFYNVMWCTTLIVWFLFYCYLL